jgi:hypothetical protein
MQGRIPANAFAPLFAALATGAAALVWPPLALLTIAALGARALMHARFIGFDVVSLAGPALAAAMVGAFAGLDGAMGALFVWRVFADTRWSVSEAARLALQAGRPVEASRNALIHAWFTPLFGVTLVAFTAPHMIAGLPLDLPHVPAWGVVGALILAAGGVFDWALRRAADWRLGELAVAPATHLLTHHIVFIVAFGLMLDVSAGIVMMIAWRLAHAAPLRAPATAIA